MDSERSNLLKRSEWLKAHGFEHDPFPFASFQAETDPVFGLKGQSAFVDPAEYDQIKGCPDDPGYRFIFGQAGSGKSSLRRRIKYELDIDVAFGIFGRPKILTIEYITHDYPEDQIKLSQHLARISDLISNALGSGQEEKNALVSDTISLYLFSKLLKKCQLDGFDAICILVDDVIDNIDVQANDIEKAFKRIEPLASCDDLLNFKNVIFKFFLPAELSIRAVSSLPLAKFPPYIIKWNKKEVRRMFLQRLSTCLDKDIREKYATLSNLCEEQLSSSIDDEIIEYGVQTGRPRAMWQLGHYLFAEHFQESQNGERASDELINAESLLKTYEKIAKTSFSLKMGDGISTVIEKVKTLLENGDIVEALEYIKGKIPDLRDNVIIRHAHLNRIEERKSLGLMTYESYDVELNCINLGIINDLNRLKQAKAGKNDSSTQEIIKFVK